MPQSKVTVVLRARPTEKFASGNLQIIDDKTLQVRDSRLGGHHDHQFAFEQILHNVTQEKVYEVCGEDTVGSVLDGFNGTILAYGQTGAGKTFTMTGGKENFRSRGVIPRVLHKLFAEIKARMTSNTTVRVSYLEIYNELCYDLLDLTTQPSEIAIMEDAKDHVYIKGLRTPVVENESEALGLLFEGETNRMIGEHQLNMESSRSHTIFTILLETQAGKEGDPLVVAKLNLVDLAGSERVSKTKSEGQVLKEATQINKSLSFLEQVIVALSEKKRDHIPYRSSKLTHVLKDSLGGNCKTLMIACIWGEAAQLDETVSTCRFAQRMRCVANDYSINTRQDPAALLRRYEQEVADLRQELALRDSMSGRAQVTYEPYTDAQRAELRASVRAFLEAKGDPHSIAPLQLQSVRQMQEILLLIKNLYLERTAAAGMGRSAQTLPAAAASARQPQPHSTAQRPFVPPHAGKANPDSFVGDLEGEEDQQMGLGVAPPDARPGQSSGAAGAASTSGREAGIGDFVCSAAPDTGPASSSTPAPDRKQAFEDYKKGPGAVKLQLLTDNKAKLKLAKRRAKELGLSINAIKQQMDALKDQGTDTPRSETQDDSPATKDSSSQERLRELKAQYRDQYAELQVVKSEVPYTQQLCEQCTQELVLEFDTWYQQQYGVHELTGTFEDLQASLDDPAHIHAGFSQGSLDSAGLRSSLRKPEKAQKVATVIDIEARAAAETGQEDEARAFYKAQTKLQQRGAAGGAAAISPVKRKTLGPNTTFGGMQRGLG
ncbi:hypothetical protein WJX72_000729 [[Myrmecia] bisecta]|uniref:Kinesin-like protein n=1 Tax=[Myrmecia] bisecta TaxID=41462 RepID=A0AAW1Q3A5_9CHLO